MQTANMRYGTKKKYLHSHQQQVKCTYSINVIRRGGARIQDKLMSKIQVNRETIQFVFIYPHGHPCKPAAATAAEQIIQDTLLM